MKEKKDDIYLPIILMHDQICVSSWIMIKQATYDIECKYVFYKYDDLIKIKS